MGSNKPSALAVNPDKIPDELKAVPRWVGWKYQFEEGRWTKKPLSCRTGRVVNALDPANWSSFEAAVKYYRRRQPDGIGFVLVDEDHYSGIDLDKCRDSVTGKIQPPEEEIVRVADSYTEITPSGTGLRVFVRAKLPSDWRKKKGNIEIYSRARFLTLTGQHLPGTPTTVEERQEQLVRVYEKVFGKMLPAIATASVAGPDDAMLIAKAMRAANGEKFARLFVVGDTADYPSESEAVLALVGMLRYWAGPDQERIERLMGLSKLGQQPKWQEREDYRENTIKRALEGYQEYPVRTRTNQTTQDESETTQDESGSVNTRLLGRPERPPSKQENSLPCPISRSEMVEASKAGEGGQSRPEVLLLSPELEEQTVQAAIDLAETDDEREESEVMFVLARRLRRLAGEEGGGKRFERAVVAYCERIGKPAEDYWFTFLVCWDKVKLAEGETPLEWALTRARKQLVVTPPSSSPLWDPYVLLGSIAYYLSTLRSPRPFILPLKKVGPLLNLDKSKVSRIINTLKKEGVIKCVKEDYSYKDGVAKEYIFIGPGGNQEKAA